MQTISFFDDLYGQEVEAKWNGLSNPGSKSFCIPALGWPPRGLLSHEHGSGSSSIAVEATREAMASSSYVSYIG